MIGRIIKNNNFIRTLSLLLFLVSFLLLVSSVTTSSGIAKGIAPQALDEACSSEPAQVFDSKLLFDTGQVSDEFLAHIFYLQPWERANSVSVSSSNDLLAVGTSSGIHVYDFQNYEEIRYIDTEKWARSVAFTRDASILAAGLFDDSIQLWDTAEGTLSEVLLGHTEWVRSIAFTSDNAILASASDDDTVLLWNVSEGVVQDAFKDEMEGARTLAFSPDNSILAVGTKNGSIYLWRVSDGVLLNTLEGHRDWIRTLEFSNDGELLASGAFDATARIWRVSDGELVHELSGHTSSVLGLAFFPDDSMLATGSVDSTVRLWQVNDGQLETTLTGHTDFVYDVDVSQDGTRLVSASGDATVRVWDLTEILSSTAQTPAHQARSSDCRACHHPPSQTKPPDVIEVRCEACHSGGAGLNWCPIFPPLLVSPTSSMGHLVSSGMDAGVPDAGKNLSITIAKPGNGEVFYVNHNFTAPARVSGQVLYENVDLSEISVYLEVWAEGEKLAEIPASVFPDGSFSVDLGLNYDGENPVELATQLDAGSVVCDDCHTEYSPLFYLPQGDVQLIVFAAAEDDIARDERWVTVDTSTTGQLNVTVVDDVTGEPVPGISVQALTRFYSWRPRSFGGVTDENGIATITLELLSQASTIYLVEIPDQTVGGKNFSGLDSVEVGYQPDDVSLSVALNARSEKGKIQGQIEAPMGSLDEAVSMFAFRLPGGPIYETSASKGAFSYDDLPIANYIVFPDLNALAAQGQTGSIQTVDLSTTAEQGLISQIVPLTGTVLHGTVVDQESGWLPFAWVSANLAGTERSIGPSDGTWTTNLEGADQSLVITAPGYYSQKIVYASEMDKEGSQMISLERRPETQVIAWGEGRIVIPPETRATVEDGDIIFESGWMWGEGDREKPIVVYLSNIALELTSGKFALEQLPDQAARFYLMDGLAEIVVDNHEGVRVIQPGSMVTIQASGQVDEVPYTLSVFDALHQSVESPLLPTWKSPWLRTIQDGLLKLGVSTAQLVTFVTYLLLFLSLVVYPIAKLYLKSHAKK